jgi:hypothetical protein
MQQLEFKLLNDISWVKPNLSCRCFTHATETIIWAVKNKNSRQTFNYKLMKEINHGKQMKSVWEIYPLSREEKRFGKHPRKTRRADRPHPARRLERRRRGPRPIPGWWLDSRRRDTLLPLGRWRRNGSGLRVNDTHARGRRTGVCVHDGHLRGN